MKTLNNIGLPEVQAVYGGAEGDLWELVMGQQVHIGGMASSMDLAERAGIGAGMTGVDLCCCSGAGMRFLVKMRQAAKMTGVDATEKVVTLGRKRNEAAGVAERIDFVLGNVCDSGLPDGCADFVWGEDAWCYVVDKARLIGEAARLVKPGGVIAFTDWLEGPAGLTGEESNRFLSFMKFPSFCTLQDYKDLLEAEGCEVVAAEDTGRFAPYVELYLLMLNQQFTFDALSIIGFNQGLLESLAGELVFTKDLAQQKKIIQGLIIARKRV